MTKDRDPIAEYCHEWVQWTRTRAFYIKTSTASLLGRMQPAKPGREPNARNHPDMQYFNMAVHTLKDMPKFQGRWLAFQAYYLEPADVRKRTADQLGIGRRTFYDHVKSFAKHAYSMAESIKKAHGALGMAPALPDPATS